MNRPQEKEWGWCWLGFHAWSKWSASIKTYEIKTYDDIFTYIVQEQQCNACNRIRRKKVLGLSCDSRQ